MTARPFRSATVRGVLAILEALAVHVAQHAASCVALPRSAIFIVPERDSVPARRVAGLALQGRAASTDATRAPRTHDR
jgi:hypothetical protein